MEELQKEKRELVEKKEELLREYNVMQRKLIKIENLIKETCAKSETGHIYIEEIEQGMYGMTFTYCKICGHEVV
tara:strand:- start:523 stop:744 length:222 start_codon:yes stop_codon:yes gene_type:complete